MILRNYRKESLTFSMSAIYTLVKACRFAFHRVLFGSMTFTLSPGQSCPDFKSGKDVQSQNERRLRCSPHHFTRPICPPKTRVTDVTMLTRSAPYMSAHHVFQNSEGKQIVPLMLNWTFPSFQSTPVLFQGTKGEKNKCNIQGKPTSPLCHHAPMSLLHTEQIHVLPVIQVTLLWK